MTKKLEKQAIIRTLSTKQQGFTLVEVMVVIVILSVFAGMMTLSVGSSENRKNLAFYEHLQSNMNYVRLLSAEQMQPYGVAIRLAKDDNPTQLVVVKLENAFGNHNIGQNPSQNVSQNVSQATLQNTEKNTPTWVLEKSISPLDVPTGVRVDIQPLDRVLQDSQFLPSYLQGNDAPPIVWFGTGEATAVQIQVQKQNSNDDKIYPIASPIIINGSGAIEQVNE
ncbi:prepilin-type N-terminal cleavage/methylation domain-containing protein [Faucicola boevrei]|uniref:prepilin-type N-terminal cleavage/methylation domain-containing protein n=1 Tax=Faucicola boevrei TaxID=346665 RepID=UPI00036EC546|nr:prepilin-type N-terminal cleavage/methylation domain-containing protein [Moraxella boevrei]